MAKVEINFWHNNKPSIQNMFHSETTAFLSGVGAKTLKNATLSIDVSRCAEAFPRLAQAYKAAKPDHAAIAKSTLLAYLEAGATLLDIKAPKKKQVDDETGIFRSDVVHAIIAVGVSAILEEYPDAVTAAESYALQTECYFKNLSGRRSKKTDRINVAKVNVAAFLAMFPSPTVDDVQTFLDAGAFVKPKATRKRATKASEVASEAAPEALAPSADVGTESEVPPSEASEASDSDVSKKSKAKKGSKASGSDSDVPKVKKASKKKPEVFEEEE